MTEAELIAELQRKLALAIEALRYICAETYQVKISVLACHTLEKIEEK